MSTSPSSDVILCRAATISDLAAIASIIAHSPDDAAAWTYPEWRAKAMEATPIHVQHFAKLFKSTQFMIRVAEKKRLLLPLPGDETVVVGYAVWVKTDKTTTTTTTTDGQVARVGITEEYDQKALETAVSNLTASFSPSQTFNTLFPNTIPSRSAAISSLRSRQDADLNLRLPSYQLLVLGVSEPHQGRGIGGMLIREGMAMAASAEQPCRDDDDDDDDDDDEFACFPIFVTGEGRGMRVYQKLGFHVLRGSWTGFDKDGKEVTTPEKVGDEGLEGAQMVWVPPGKSAVVKDVMYIGDDVVIRG